LARLCLGVGLAGTAPAMTNYGKTR
jgi:hypothetical protein